MLRIGGFRNSNKVWENLAECASFQRYTGQFSNFAVMRKSRFQDLYWTFVLVKSARIIVVN